MVSGGINFEEFFFFFLLFLFFFPSLASDDLFNSVFLADAVHLKIKFDDADNC